MKKALKSRRMKGLSLNIEISPELEDQKDSELAPEVEDADPVEDPGQTLMAGGDEAELDEQALDPMSIAEAVMGKADQTLAAKPTKSLGEKAKMKMMELLKHKGS